MKAQHPKQRQRQRQRRRIDLDEWLRKALTTPDDVLDPPGIRAEHVGKTKRLLVELHRYARDGVSSPSHTTLCSAVDLGLLAVLSRLQRLEGQGWFRLESAKHQGRGHRSKYHLAMPKNTSPEYFARRAKSGSTSQKNTSPDHRYIRHRHTPHVATKPLLDPTSRAREAEVEWIASIALDSPAASIELARYGLEGVPFAEGDAVLVIDRVADRLRLTVLDVTGEVLDEQEVSSALMKPSGALQAAEAVCKVQA